MAGLFDGSAAWLTNAATPVTGYPFSVGCWAMLTTSGGGNQCIFTLSDTGTTNNYYQLRKTAVADTIEIKIAVGSSTSTATIATAETVNSWFYVLLRCISSVNRKIAVLHASGLVEHATVSTNLTPGSIDCVGIGAVNISTGPTSFWPGLIGELWWTNTDVQADGAQANDDFVRQLAAHGPFSVPHVTKDLIEYHAMRSSLPSAFAPGDSYFGKRGIQTWSNAASLVGQHPPLPYEYDRPVPVARMLMV